MKITYLLGAGASYNAIPIVGELNQAFLNLASICDNYIPDDDTDTSLIELKKQFNINMYSGEKLSKLFGTIDTYAKKLSLTNPADLKKLKHVLSLFFTMWQELDKKLVIDSEYFNHVRKGNFEDIDHRYFGLLLNYIDKNNLGLYLNENVNFITWNYDTQLERALSIITNKTVNEEIEAFNVYPYNYVNKKYDKPKIIHLNGIAGLYNKKGNDETQTLFELKQHASNQEIVRQTINFIGDALDEIVNNNEYFTYAWETDKASKEAFDFSVNIIKETDILVVIGYSFPTFNDEIDKKLFNALDQKKLRKVYYQDPKATKELIYSRFGIDKDKIEPIVGVEQFILPLDSHNLKEDTFEIL